MTVRLSQRNGYYYAIVSYKENNQLKTKWEALHLRTDAPLREAKKLIKLIEEEYETKYSSDEEPLFTQYLAQWVEKRKGLVAMSTWEGYCTYAYKHIIPYFQPMNLKLKDLTPSHIQDYYNYKYTSGRMDRKKDGLAIESIIKHKSVIMTALDSAVIDELIPSNPAKYVKLPAKRSSKRQEVFLSLKETNEMLKLFVDTPFYAIVYTTLYYGLRKSEALGLKWSSIDFEHNKLTLENTIVKNLTTVEKPTMKTSASYHTYPLLPCVRRVLLKQRAWQMDNENRFGDQYQHSDYVFTWEDGRPFRADGIYRSFQRVLQRNHFTPVLRFHDLRHSTASILYEQGFDLKDIQTWLRHADISVTMNTYVHIKQMNPKDVPDYLKNVFAPTRPQKAKILGKPNSEN